MQAEQIGIQAELHALRTTNPLLQDFDHYWVIDTYAPEDQAKVEVQSLQGNDFVEIYLKQYELLTQSILWVNIFNDNPDIPEASELRKQIETPELNEDPDQKALVLAKLLAGNEALQTQYKYYQDLRQKFMIVGHRYRDRVSSYVLNLNQGTTIKFDRLKQALGTLAKEEIRAAFSDDPNNPGIFSQLPYEEHIRQDEMIPHEYLREELWEDFNTTFLNAIQNLADRLDEEKGPGSKTYRRYSLVDLQTFSSTKGENFTADDVQLNTRFRSCPAHTPIVNLFRMMATNFEFNKYGIKVVRPEKLADIAK